MSQFPYKSGKNVIVNEVAFMKGLIYGQLFNDNMLLKSFDEINAEFENVMNWYQYRQLCAAIPRTWLNCLHSNFNLTNGSGGYQAFYDIVQSKQKPIKFLYDHLISKENDMQPILTKIKK